MHVKTNPKKLFYYSSEKGFYIWFCLVFLKYSLALITKYSAILFNFEGQNPLNFAWNLRVFFIHEFPLLLFGLILILNNFPSMLYYLNKILKCLLQISLFVASVILFSLSFLMKEQFNFWGYEARPLNLLVYCLIALYLYTIFKKENVLKIMLVMVLAVLIVGELWEFPLNLFYNSKLPLHYIFFDYLFRFTPFLFLWFYEFRGIYKRFSKWKALFVLIPIGFFTTIIILSENLLFGYLSYTFLRVSYALAFVFLPFQEYFACMHMDKIKSGRKKERDIVVSAIHRLSNLFSG